MSDPGRVLLALLTLLAAVGVARSQDPIPAGYRVDDLLVGACRLPPQLVGLGTRSRRLGPRRVVMATGVECGIRGGEFVAYDPANLDTAREFWTSEAARGDPKAQNYLGEIYERGLGTGRDYELAAMWYREAAEQGYSAAQFNLGKLYELGQGVEQDLEEALRWYRMSAGLETLQFDPGLQVEPQLQPTSRADVPIIHLLDPLVAYTRGITVVPTPGDVDSRTITGLVESQAPLQTLTVNETAIPFLSSGRFEARVPVTRGGSTVRILAVDSAGRSGERAFRLNPGETPADVEDFGRYTALVIGIQNYTHLQPLRTPLNDARVVAEVLRNRYGFDDVRLLEDATREQIMRALNALRTELTENDNLLIYYAGHGVLDELNTRGYWQPKDAESADTTNWIPNTAVTDTLNHMQAKSVLVVADSCYAGALLRSSATSMTADVEILRSKRSRTALTSGGLAPVLDDGRDGHSVFANAFIDVLNANESVVDAQQLLLMLRANVAEAASGRDVEQVPMHGAINLAGHENGAFFFVPRATAPEAVALERSARAANIPAEAGRVN